MIQPAALSPGDTVLFVSKDVWSKVRPSFPCDDNIAGQFGVITDIESLWDISNEEKPHSVYVTVTIRNSFPVLVWRGPIECLDRKMTEEELILLNMSQEAMEA